jgi:hypothetical protein
MQTFIKTKTNETQKTQKNPIKPRKFCKNTIKPTYIGLFLKKSPGFLQPW